MFRSRAIGGNRDKKAPHSRPGTLAMYIAQSMSNWNERDKYLFPLQCAAVLSFWGASNGTLSGMRAGLERPLTLPLPLWKLSTFSPRLVEVCISSSVLFISLAWGRLNPRHHLRQRVKRQAVGLESVESIWSKLAGGASLLTAQHTHIQRHTYSRA